VYVAVPAAGEKLELDRARVGAVGFAVVVAGETQVTQIATTPSVRRRGLGMRMVKTLIGIDPRATAVLEVKASNAPAIEMYEKCGFSVSSRRREYYADGDDALCMTRVPPEPPVSTRELTRLLAGLPPDRARAPAPALPEKPPAEPRAERVDAPRLRDAFRRAPPSEDSFKMPNRFRRRP